MNKPVKSNSKFYGILPKIVLISLIVILALLTSNASGNSSRIIIPEDLLQQWNRIRSESPDSGKMAAYFDEGEKIIQRLQELDDLRQDPKQTSREDFFQRVAHLQERFKFLLFSIEMARLTSMPEGEMEQMRNRYLAEKRELLAEIYALEDSIIVRGEHFLNTYKQQIALKHYMNKQEMIVDFVYRLAEIYYRRAEETFFRTNDISVFKPALEKYQRIIDEFPASDYVDDALYNIAYVKNNSQSVDERLEAITLYLTLITKYNTSPFVPEAYWRVAEHYFYQRPSDVDNAIHYYSALLNYPHTNWYVRSLYKIGWCHFIDADYTSAVDYFTRTVETSMAEAQTSDDMAFTGMTDEALEYISVCFAQDSLEWAGSGVAPAVAFVQGDSLRRDTYGKQILAYLGDIYQKQVGKYSQAISAYKAYLDMYPLDAQAPWIQEKIINCYAVNLRQFEDAYLEKDRMFTLYRSGEAWEQANPDSQLRADADIIIEKYYFQNINETIGRSLKVKDKPQIEQCVVMSRNYLEEFPEGPNAYTVNYNLAIMLDQHAAKPEEAFAEYIKVSKDYPDDKHRKDAAVNAVVIAQKMISQLEEKPAEEVLGTELTDAEMKYITAAGNYLEHFPQGEEAELFLLNAGSIYYNHGLYAESRPYYDTLLVSFPEGKRRGEAYHYIMNGYFAEGNYAEAERIAKEIQGAGFDSTMVAKARVRQAESVFLNAQGMKEQGDLLTAAAEYRRVALETPDYAQADKALFESGLTFQQAKSWADANEVYLLLVAKYPGSELADKALYNVGYNNQSELGDKKTAAETFERLSREYPNSALTQDALRNASINYVEAQDWQGAIRVNSSYVQMFPDAPDANVYLFDNAGLYLKLGDEAAADGIYAAYAARFPNDPRAVRAHWERGQYLQEKSRLSEALAEFAAGIETHRTLVESGGAGEETYASRCLSEVVRAEFQTYETIQFTPASAVETSKQRKLAQREYLLELLEELNRLAKDEMFEGLYGVGKVEEELAKAFAEQALPEKGNAEEIILTREIANQDAIEISERSIESYIKAAEDIKVASQVLQDKISELEQHKTGLSAWLIEAQKVDTVPEGTADSNAVLTALDRSLSEVKSAHQNAQEWEKRAREKVPELAIRNAEIKLSTVQAFLELPDVGKNDEMRMYYRFGVLSEFAAPRGTGVIELYRKAIERARYSTAPEEWKSKALQGVEQIFSVLDREYRDLNERSLTAFSQYYTTYQDLLTQGEGATTRGGLEAADVAEKLVLFSDYSHEFGIGALSAQDILLATVEAGEEIPADLRDRLTASAVEEVFRINERYTNLVSEARESMDHAKGLQEESVIWEDAAMTYEDCIYSFSGHEETLLNTALEFNKIHGNDQTIAMRIGWELVAIDREKYLSLLADYGTEHWIRSDESFRVSSDYHTSWESLDFSTEEWIAPRVNTISGHESDNLAGCQALWIPTEADTLVSDSLYLRQVFTVDEEPVAGELFISVDGGYVVQLNGEFVGASDPVTGWTEVASYDVSQGIRKDKNVIAVMVVDPDLTTQGVLLALKYKVLPAKQPGGP